VFVELAGVQHLITIEFENVKNGILVTSTSEDDEVVKLIRAHAYKVSEFVERGMEAMHEATPLPADYNRDKVGARPEDVAEAPVAKDQSLLENVVDHSNHGSTTAVQDAAPSCCRGSQCNQPASED
jgi:hypothetical protein